MCVPAAVDGGIKKGVEGVEGRQERVNRLRALGLRRVKRGEGSGSGVTAKQRAPKGFLESPGSWSIGPTVGKTVGT